MQESSDQRFYEGRKIVEIDLAPGRKATKIREFFANSQDVDATSGRGTETIPWFCHARLF